MNEKERYKTQENIRLYRLSEEERKNQFKKFHNINDEKDKTNKNGKNSKRDLKKSYEAPSVTKRNKELREFFAQTGLIKEVAIPQSTKEFNKNNGFSRFINTLKIDLFSINNHTRIKFRYDLINTFLSLVFKHRADYVNDAFFNTIHIDLISPIADLSLFSNEILKIKKERKISNLRIYYLFRILNVFAKIDIGACAKYLAILETRVAKPFKYYELAPILKHLYVPLVILENTYNKGEIHKCIKELKMEFPEKIRIAINLEEMIENYFKVYKCMMFPLLLKDMGGIYYEIDNESEEFKENVYHYFNLAKSDFIESNFNIFEKKLNKFLEKRKKEKEIQDENENAIMDEYHHLPAVFSDIINILSEFFPSNYIELKKSKKNKNYDYDENADVKFDIKELANFTDIFRYFHCPSDIKCYVLDDKLLYFSKFYPMSQLSVLSLMTSDLCSVLTNIKYLPESYIRYDGEDYSPLIFFKSIIQDINVLHKYTVNKMGDIIRDMSLSYTDNAGYLRTSSFESYLDELTIFLKKNYLPHIRFNQTITGLGLNNSKFSKFDVKKTLFINPFYVSIEKLKFGLDKICNNIDKRNGLTPKYIKPEDLDGPIIFGNDFNYKSAFEFGLRSIFIKTDFNGEKLLTVDQRTVYNCLFFIQKFVDLVNYIVNSEKSYILTYSHPSTLRNQPDRLLRVMDEGTKKLILECKSIKINQLIDQNMMVKKNLLLENVQLKKEVEDSKLNATTGIYSKKYFIERFPVLVNEAKSTDKELSLIIIDLDDFKKLNDTAGHKFGDFVLLSVGNMLKDIIRKNDIVSDYKGKTDNKELNKFASCFGGDEFVLLLTYTNLEKAKKVASRILEELNGNVYYKVNKKYKSDLKNSFLKKEIKKEVYDELVKRKYTIGASIGVVQYNKKYSKDNFFEIADIGVYASKMHGKNCYSIYKGDDEYAVFKKSENTWSTSNVSYNDVKIWQSKNK